MKVALARGARSGGWAAILEGAIAIAIGISAAHWTWEVFAPGASAALPGEGIDASEAPAVRRGLLGSAGARRPAAAPETASVPGLKLVGVLARDGNGKGRAIIALESGRPKIVEAGSQIAHGLVLKEVHADHILVFRSGNVERIGLQRRAVPPI